MSILDSLILGILQGLTEFLPISSSGHLILAGHVLGVSEMPLIFELIVHLATLLAIVIVMRKTVWSLVKKPLQKTNALLIVATIPTVIIFFIFRSLFESAMDGRFLIYCFGITAILLLVSGTKRKVAKNKNADTLKPLPTFIDAPIIGIAQGVAGFPGISRSGITIATAKLLGVEQSKAAEFSFLLSVPIILGSSLFAIIEGSNSSFSGVSAVSLLVGFVTAFVTGLACVKFMLKLLQSRSMTPFAVYLIILVVFLIVNRFFLHLF